MIDVYAKYADLPVPQLLVILEAQTLMLRINMDRMQGISDPIRDRQYDLLSMSLGQIDAALVPEQAASPPPQPKGAHLRLVEN